jgi:NADH dehydrogenase
MSAQGLRASVAGLAGLPQGGAGVIPDLTAAAFIGAGFGLLFRYQPLAYAATISSGVLYGLLWWILGPLTLAPLLAGRGPTWTLPEASAALPSLVGHVVFGAITGLAFYVFVAAYVRRHSERTPVPDAPVPTTQIVILGGGFGGVSAAQRLEQLLARRPSTSIVLVSQSNYLLFTPMLAEVASSGLEAQHISAPVRAALPHTRFLRGEVEAIDVGGRTVTVRESASATAEMLPYDHLILALGSVPNFYGLPGLAQHAFTLKRRGCVTTSSACWKRPTSSAMRSAGATCSPSWWPEAGSRARRWWPNCLIWFTACSAITRASPPARPASSLCTPGRASCPRSAPRSPSTHSVGWRRGASSSS